MEKAVGAITGALSKHHNSSIFAAVMEVNVEMRVECPSVGESPTSINHMILESTAKTYTIKTDSPVLFQPANQPNHLLVTQIKIKPTNFDFCS